MILLFIGLLLALPCNIQAAEYPKAPPPVLLNRVESVPAYVNVYSYFRGNYMISVDKIKNTVTIYDVSDPAHPVLISVNQYGATEEETKKSDAG